MKTFLKEYWIKFDFNTWALDNILWFFLISVGLFGLIKLFYGIFRALYVSRKLLSQNRDTKGNAWGKHYADRFIDMWYSTDKNPLQYFGKSLYKFPNTINSRHWIEVIDSELCDLGLIKRDNSTYDSIFKPVRNWKNKIVLFMVEVWLVYIVGDNYNSYSDLKKRLDNDN